MKYSLAKYTQTISNTVEGSVALTTDEVIQIISTTTANVVIPTASGTVSGTLVLDCDLGVRVHVDEVQYYFDSVAPSGIVASGIKFYYKNEEFEVYTSLNTYYNDTYYYTIVSGTEAPRYIRVEHTVISGASGSLNGFQVLNDDTYVDFGEDGSDTDHNVNLSLENAIVEINTLFVHNSGPIKANAKLLIEPQNTVADDILSISDSADGPWYGVYRDEDMVTGPGLWETGNMDNLQETSDVLKLLGSHEVGTYTTRIIKLEEDQRLTFNVMEYSYPAVAPETEFIDDFSNGNDAGKWTEVTNPQYIAFTSGRLSMYNANTRTATTQTLEYGEDWLFQCRFYETNSCNLDIYIVDGSEYLLFRVQTGTITDKRIEFISSAGTKYSWTDDAAVQAFVYQKWTWLEVQQNFNTLSFKMWNDGTPVASGIEAAYTIPYSEIADTGKIDFRIRSGNNAHTIYIDDVTLIKNYTATPSSKSIIATEDIDTLENIEVRSSNDQPMDRLSYIEMTGSYAAATKYTQHRWAADSSIAETSVDWSSWGRSGNYFEYWYDSVREDEYIVDKPFYTGSGGNTTIYFRIRRKSGAVTSKTISNADYDADRYYSTFKLIPDETGGFWIYFFLASSDINNGIYYLRYYDSSFTQIYNRQADSAQGTFLYDMDAVYESNGDLWYTDRDLSTVFKTNREGTILASYLATEDIRGIFALNDGGCWFIQASALIRIDSNGAFVESVELSVSTASYVYSDLNGGFWLHDGYTIRHIAPDGTEYFNIEMPNLYFFTVVDSGVITKQHDGSIATKPQASYISKEHKRVLSTWDYPVNEGGWKGTFDYNRYGVRSHTYDDLTSDHASHFPISIDSQWSIFSEWKPASLRDYNFTSEQYHQLRFTLRADNSPNSPEVYGLWTQRAIEISNIYPGNNGAYYLKSDVSYLSPNDTGDYTSKVRAYWYLNTE